LLLTITTMLLVAQPFATAKRTGKKKLTLEQLAALEWKLEQADTAIRSNPKAAERKKALDDLATVDDPRAIKSLAVAIREDPDPTIRKRAAELLPPLKTPEAKGLLTLASQADPDAGVRELAKQGLKKFSKRTGLARVVIKPLADTPPTGKPTSAVFEQTLALPSADARLWAVDSLTTLQLPNRIEILAKQLQQDPSARVRIRAVEVIAQLAGPQALPALIKVARDGDPTVRYAVAKAVAQFDDGGALLVLQQLASSDENKEVRETVRDLLEPNTPVGQRLFRERLAKLRAANPVLRVQALDELSKFTDWRAMVPMSCALLNDKTLVVRQAAARTLQNMHDRSILTALRVAAVIESDAKQLKTVRGILGNMRKRVDALVNQLQSKDVTQRVLAARALGQAAYPQGQPALIQALKDTDARVRLEATMGLTNYDDNAALQALRLAGSDSDKRVRQTIDLHFKKLDRLRGWRAFYKDPNRLVMKTTDKSPIWRIDAAVALGIAGAERAAGNLISLLHNDQEEAVRLAAAWALVLMASDAGEKALKKAASEDKSERVRLTARKYMVIDKVALVDLMQQLQDERSGVRRDAAEALSLRPTGAALQPLIRTATCDSDPAARGAALRGLARIGNAFARSVIKVTQDRDEDKDVRRTAMIMYILATGK
jgi:HEAT repeat protein